MPADFKGSEKELQAACEKLLDRAGYRRLTEKNMVAHAWCEHNGWYAHWPQAIGNPIMPDLVVWNESMTRTLMVELKASDKAKVRKAQKAMITQRKWKVCFSESDFSAVLDEWGER